MPNSDPNQPAWATVLDAENLSPEPPTGDPAATTAPLMAKVIQDPARRSILGWLADRCEQAFGLVSLIVCLAILAAIPIVQLLCLGYLLEASARVARTGKPVDGFIGLRQAARVGSIFVGSWICLLPLMLSSNFWYSAQLIAPESAASGGWRLFTLLAAWFAFVQILWACYRGGKLRHFLWPAPVRFCRTLFTENVLLRASSLVWEAALALRLRHYFWLGLRGFCGALIWLFVPVLLIVASLVAPEGGVLAGLLGYASLILIVLYLPFLQTNFAVQQRFRAMFALGAVRQQFRRAPLAYLCGLFATVVLSMPLYAFHIEPLPGSLMMIPTAICVVFLLPARLVLGWGWSRANRPGASVSSFLIRIPARLATVPVAGFYVFVVGFASFVTWHGVWSLFQQHAFMVPVPIFGGG